MHFQDTDHIAKLSISNTGAFKDTDHIVKRQFPIPISKYNCILGHCTPREVINIQYPRI